MWSQVVLVAFVAVPALVNGVSTSKDVTAPTGVYAGQEAVTDAGTPYFSWLGIRYATADRFKEAKIVEESTVNFDATKNGDYCLQQDGTTFKGSEDCLTLKIYAPKNATGLPVLVYIPIGRYLSYTRVNPDYFIDTKRVVYVVVQSRINLLGFLDFGSDEFPSNLGLKDLVVALKWVQQNIAAFGGEPAAVTVQGQSSGGNAVQLLMYSPLAKGLFRGAITESGTACAPWALVPPTTARRTLTRVAALTSCPAPPASGPALETARCLQKKSVNDLGMVLVNFTMGTGKNGTERLFTVRPYQPVLEPKNRSGAFITEYPWKKPKSQVPWLTGINSFEGFKRLFNIPEEKVIEQRNLSVLPILLLYRDTTLSPNLITEEIKRFYLGSNTSELNDSAVLDFYYKVISDNMYNFPMEQCLNLHNGSKSWAYFFGYRSEAIKNYPGVPHGGELEYIFKTNGKNVRANGSDNDKKISNTLVDLLVSFAETLEAGTSDIKWDTWSAKSRNSLVLDEHGVRQLELPFKNRIDFWLSLPFRNKLLHS